MTEFSSFKWFRDKIVKELAAQGSAVQLSKTERNHVNHGMKKRLDAKDIADNIINLRKQMRGLRGV